MAKKIFITEDDKFLREMLAQKFTGEGYEVEVAETGGIAVEKLGKNVKADLFVSDLLLPDMDGFDVLKAIQDNSSYKGKPVMVLSNLDKPEDMTRAKGLGAKEFLVKSNFTVNEILAKVKDFLGA